MMERTDSPKPRTIEALPDSKVDSLIREAECGVKEYRRHWFTLGLAIPHYFKLEEQLQAIYFLGRSRSPKALEYLKRLNEVTEWTDSPDPSTHNCDYGDIIHLHAKGPLREALTERWSILCPPSQNYDKKMDPRTVEVLETAIKDLEDFFQKAEQK